MHSGDSLPSFDDAQQWLQPSVGELGNVLHGLVTAENEERVLGPDLAALVRSGQAHLPRQAVISLALFSDCLRAAEVLIHADNQVSAAEVDYVYPLMCQVAQTLGRERPEYRGYLDPDRILDFLARYKADAGLFGYACADTRWVGLDICRRAWRETGDGEPLALYRRLQARLIDEVLTASEMTVEQAARDSRLAEVMDLRARLTDPEVIEGEGDDARIRAFLSDEAPQVFSSAAAPTQVWERDRLDVESVHTEARDAFERLLGRVTGPDHDGRGRILLVLGESGSGKTHLMRAFRSHVHGRGLGFVGYLQLTSRTDDYAAYVLRNLIDSLTRSYAPPEVERSGMMLLSDAVAEIRAAIPPAALTRLREDELDLRTLAGDTVSPLVDRLLGLPGFGAFDPDLLRVLLYLQRNAQALNSRVFKYLRCEELAPYDREQLGGISPRAGGDGAQRTIEDLGRLMWQASGRALVLLVDQLEDLVNLDDERERFRRVVDVLRHVADNVPRAVIVISCLDDMYQGLRAHLTRSSVDRLERDPDSIQLGSRRTADEIAAIAGRRLQVLYEDMNVRFRPDDPLFPFRRAHLDALANQRIRDVLDTCRQHQEECAEAGKLVPWSRRHGAPAGAEPERADAPAPAPLDTTAVAQAWNDHHHAFARPTPTDDDPALLVLLAGALDACGRELGDRYRIACQPAGELLRVTVQKAGHASRTLAVGMCNKPPQGGYLGRQIESMAARAGTDTLAMVRCTEFPGRPGSQLATQIGRLVGKGARTVVIGDADWRLIHAYRDFAEARGGDAAFLHWARGEQPLAGLKCFRDLLDLEALAELPALTTAAPVPEPAPDGARAAGQGSGHGTDAATPAGPAAAPSRGAPGPASRQPTSRLPTAPPQDRAMNLGHTGGLQPQPLALDLDELTRHAAFLGSTGSGKTTLALAILEQALARGIPAILVDRKGDLCRYADPTWWNTPLGDVEHEARKRALRERVDVHLYTPGKERGRPLGIPVIPPGLAEASTLDRVEMARHAASALGAVMGYRATKADQIQEAILANAIEILGAIGGSGAEPSLDMLVRMVSEQDESLLAAVGNLAKPKYFVSLAENLELIRHSKQHLLSRHAEPLDASELLGRNRLGAKTRLSIISTRFLTDQAEMQFWVARLVVEIARWASKHPSPSLQALIFFDEADIYMPAQSKPATKEPMQDLLKRARSAGVGVFLGTQNPGDLDYKSRENVLTWFVGRVTEERNLEKLKSLLSHYQTSFAGRLAKKKAGEFVVLRKGEVSELKAERALMATVQLGEDEILALARATARPPDTRGA
jgi:Helicase HerA, central domain/AAA ATPase domain